MRMWLHGAYVRCSTAMQLAPRHSMLLSPCLLPKYIADTQHLMQHLPGNEGGVTGVPLLLHPSLQGMPCG